MHAKVSKAKVSKAEVARLAITQPEAIPLTWAGKVPQIQPATYADGLPAHDLNYLGFKMILKVNRFTSRKSLFDFGKVIRDLAKAHRIDFRRVHPADAPLRFREVLFKDTGDHRFYNNAFILRRRIEYEDGFPVGEPEVVFKFRHTDIQKAAETDVRPHIDGPHRVKFKAQALPLKGALGGIRMLFSHNVQFPRGNLIARDREFSMEELTRIFPVLERIKKDPKEQIALVSETIIEEVLQDLGVLDFGSGVKAKTDVAIWRTRGEHRPLIGELAYQIKVKDRKELDLDVLKRMERFFIALQYAALVRAPLSRRLESHLGDRVDGRGFRAPPGGCTPHVSCPADKRARRVCDRLDLPARRGNRGLGRSRRSRRDCPRLHLRRAGHDDVAPGADHGGRDPRVGSDARFRQGGGRPRTAQGWGGRIRKPRRHGVSMLMSLVWLIPVPPKKD
jgi:hypothetical protein